VEEVVLIAKTCSVPCFVRGPRGRSKSTRGRQSPRKVRLALRFLGFEAPCSDPRLRFGDAPPCSDTIRWRLLLFLQHLIVSHPQLLDFAGEGVAAPAEQGGGVAFAAAAVF